MSDPIDARGVLVALGADPNDYDRVIPLLDRHRVWQDVPVEHGPTLYMKFQS